MIRLFGGLLLLLACGCAATPPARATRAPVGAGKLVYVVSHGWHVGILMARGDVSTVIWPESADLGAARYLEVGWGDAEFYRAPEGTVGLALKAAFSSESTVLHVAAFHTPITEVFDPSRLVAIAVSPNGFDALTRFVAESYARDAGGRPTVLGPGLYGESRFYRATSHYRLFDNSNNWAAKALRAAGCPIEPEEMITAGSVMRRAENLARAGCR